MNVDSTNPRRTPSPPCLSESTPLPAAFGGPPKAVHLTALYKRHTVTLVELIREHQLDEHDSHCSTQDATQVINALPLIGTEHFADEIATIRDMIAACLTPVTPKREGDDDDLGIGICRGTALDHLIHRAQGASGNLTLTGSPLARFLQASYELFISFDTNSDENLKYDISNTFEQYTDDRVQFLRKPSKNNLLECYEEYVTLIQYATRRLGLFHRRKHYAEQARKLKVQIHTEPASTYMQILKDMDATLADLKSAQEKWHDDSQKLSQDLRLLQRRGVEYRALLDREVPTLDIPKVLTSLRQQIKSADGYLYVSFSCSTTSVTKSTLCDTTSGLSQLFFQYMIDLASRYDERPFKTLQELKNGLDKTTRIEVIKDFRYHCFDIFAEQVALNRLGKDAPRAVQKRVISLLHPQIKRELTRFEKSEDMPQLKRHKHGIVMKLTPPYDLRDPNLPDFKGFQTSDFNQFLRFVILWMVHSNYTHMATVREIFSNTPAGDHPPFQRPA